MLNKTLFVACVLNLIMLIWYYVYSERLFCFKYETQVDLQNGGMYFAIIHTDVTVPNLYF